VQPKKVIVTSIIGVAALAGIVILAQLIRSSAGGQGFIETYPGFVAPAEGTPEGFPAWLGWQHFLNAFFLVLIIRTGWIIRSKVRPPAFWTRSDAGILRITGPKKRMGIYHWFHLCLDFLWVLNGIIFIVLLFVTGQWLRIVPTSWEVFPNALSAAIQYASFTRVFLDQLQQPAGAFVFRHGFHRRTDRHQDRSAPVAHLASRGLARTHFP
jgi:hypothetical protein